MTSAKNLRQVHRFLAPLMLLPILLTVLTGSFYQLVDMAGKGEAFDWLMDLHKGNFGIVDLQVIYPFLNSLGLLILIATGIFMWLQPKRRFQKKLNS
ncbi:PepSY domain-containing protein [Nodosilinea nodulosa]|uniref:PepSY domain-containing protein n=1 Tax=Nodosilinea nodulosa TaxID=416001 RepID=UPI0003198779|nr:PepSY domain-containing protein [Nodosilinea nodulosa]